MIRKYISGDVVEMSKFPVGNAAKVRAPRNGTSPPRKQEQNERAAERRLARLINCNFAHGALLLTLTYSTSRLEQLVTGIIKAGLGFGSESIRAAAIKERDNFLRRVKAEMKKQGAELKYIAVTSDVNGETGGATRVHHHLIVPKSAFDAVTKHWGTDEVDIRPLRDQQDYTPVAVYMLRQVRRQKDRSKWSASRNLAGPKISEEIVYNNTEIKAPRGAKVSARTYDSEHMSQYLRYVKAPTKPRRKQKQPTGGNAGRHTERHTE